MRGQSAPPSQQPAGIAVASTMSTGFRNSSSMEQDMIPSSMEQSDLGPVAPRSQLATRAKAIGALALGCLALGAFAIGTLAIGKLWIGRARIARLEIDELVVKRLSVLEELQPPTAQD